MILLILEQSAGQIPRSGQQVISAAKQAAKVNGIDSIKALVIGSPEQCESAATDAARYGLDEIFWIGDRKIADRIVLATAAAISFAVDQLKPSFVIACATSLLKSALPRVASKFEAGQASDLIDFPEKGVFRRPIFAGNIIADVEITSELKFLTVRSSAFEAQKSENGSVANVTRLEFQDFIDSREEFVSFDTIKSERPELSSAEVVIAGGRALQSKDNFEKYILPLADCLNGAIGASRAAVDAGYAPNDWQIGQTGKVVAPRLYIGVGISGAIQHLAGMKDSKTIVAINTDEEAPIFEIADYGLVADLYDVVPQLTEALEKRGRS